MFFIIFIIGICIGSFLNVLIDRLSRNESIQGRSYCEFCKAELHWYDLVPVLSFVWLRGRCRYCKAKLSYQYPLVEFLTGVLFAFTYYFSMVNDQWSMVNLVYYLVIISSLIVIFFTDLKYGIIPDRIVFPSIAITIIWLLINHQSLIINHFLSALGASVFFLLIYLLTKGKGMGFGDVKFAFLMGLILGVSGTVLALYIAFLTGAAVGIILILWKKKRMNFAVPFGPFLVLGTLLSLFFAGEIIPKVLPLFF